MSDDGCCHKTRLRGAPCPIGWSCPYIVEDAPMTDRTPPIDPLNKLCKWRSVLAGWHTGTKSALDASGARTPGVQAMRDLMDKWLIMRAEHNALTQLLISKGIFTAAEFSRELQQEAALLDHDMEIVFPGFRTNAEGVVIYDADKAFKTMTDLGFPP